MPKKAVLNGPIHIVQRVDDGPLRSRQKHGAPTSERDVLPKVDKKGS